MRPEDHAAEVAELVKAAVDSEPAARQAFLEAHCRPELREEV